MNAKTFSDAIAGKLIISCYADHDYNSPFCSKDAMIALATSVARGGAGAIRVNLRHVAYVKASVGIPVIGIEKVYRDGEMRITPTLREVEALVMAGADAIAIDATRRPRFDALSLQEYIREIKQRYDIPIIGDVSTVEEGMNGAQWGLDLVGTTLSGYTPYSPTFGKLGDIPPANPDYDIIRQLVSRIRIPVIAEGRYNTPEKVVEALNCGAHAVVVGTAISNPQKITEHFCYALTTRV